MTFADFFQSILDKIDLVVVWIGKLYKDAFIALWDLFKDGLSWSFEQMLSVASAALNSVDLSGVTANLQNFGSIPANVMAVLSCLGLGQALALVTAAIGIRFALQLIPFIRLGS
jgi:hypothetical protein